VAVGIGHVGGWRRSATGESPRRHAKAHGAPPSSIARIHVRFKARNAHHAYSGRAPAQGSSFKRRARHSNRVFPNHQARCALLIPLRFEFDNEFHSRNPNEEPLSRPMREPIRWTAVPPSAAFRPRGVTPKRGNNVASPLRRTPATYPAKTWTYESHRLARAPFNTRFQMRSRVRPRLRSASTDYGASKQSKANRRLRAPAICNRHVEMG
jgi:hypothetical protein